ncbi:MAG: hypothetical protein Q4D76_00185 [Oscillospiraceae bacterium]|nr:hypothetical protein [Oscillospiraceae bacterium]
MTGDDLIDAISMVDDDLLAEAAEYKKEKYDHTPFVLISAVAATVALCVGVYNHSESSKPGNEFEINNNYPGVVSEITAYNTETAEFPASSFATTEPVLNTETAKPLVSSDVPDKETIVLHTDSPVNLTDRIVSVSTESSGIPWTNTHTEPAQIPETPVFTEAVKTEPVITVSGAEGIPETPVFTEAIKTEPEIMVPVVSGSVTEPEYDFDLYENVIGSFGANAILLDYTKDSRAAMVINEDGRMYYLEDGGTKSIVKMKDGELPPEKEINKLLGSNYVKFKLNTDGSYNLNTGEYKEKVYELLENNSNVLSIVEEQTVYERIFYIISIIIKSDDSPQEIVKKYPELNLRISESPHEMTGLPGEGACEYYCIINKTRESYEALKKLHDSGCEFIFYVVLAVSNSNNKYSTYTKNILQR